MEKLKERWGIESNWQIVIIFIVFAITGTAASKLAAPLTEFIGLQKETTNPYIFWPVRILLIFPIYQILLVFFGWVFGQFNFFWNMEKKMLKRIGLGFLINGEEKEN